MSQATVEALDVALREVLTLYAKKTENEEPEAPAAAPARSLSEGHGYLSREAVDKSIDNELGEAERGRVVAVARMLVDVDVRARRKGPRRSLLSALRFVLRDKNCKNASEADACAQA